MALFFVYLAEYPDEGSTVADAHDEEAALVEVAGTGDEADNYSVRRVTVADIERLQEQAGRAKAPSAGARHPIG